ncbi:hypothetical protein MMC14_002929 [Varicellaria rhodocarpa]|nr:hypothetical protein [Varicellaria rhodocarpa]
MSATNNYPAIKLLQDYRLTISSGDNEVSDAMMIILRCIAYQALEFETVKLSKLLKENLQEDVEVLVGKIEINYSYLAHKVEKPAKLPFIDTIKAIKNAKGARSWDTRISLPISSMDSVNVFLQSKLRQSGRNLARAEVSHEFNVMSKWKVKNPRSQMILISEAELVDIDTGKHAGLLYVNAKKLDAYFGKIVGKRRGMLSVG